MKKILFALFALVISGVATAQVKMKPLQELIDQERSGIDYLNAWRASSRCEIEVLPKDNTRADSALYRSQLLSSSPIGSIIYGSGGIMVDHGWLRILGSGCERMQRSLPEWNKGKTYSHYGDKSNFLLIADDAIGGFFAVNTTGSTPRDPYNVYYYGPNSLTWLPIGLDYQHFISYCLSGGIRNFYEGFRWKGWEDDVQKLSTNEVVTCYPLLWTREGKELKCNRKVMDIQKLWDTYPTQKMASLRSSSEPSNYTENTRKSTPSKKSRQ